VAGLATSSNWQDTLYHDRALVGTLIKAKPLILFHFRAKNQQFQLFLVASPQTGNVNIIAILPAYESRYNSHYVRCRNTTSWQWKA